MASISTVVAILLVQLLRYSIATDDNKTQRPNSVKPDSYTYRIGTIQFGPFYSREGRGYFRNVTESLAHVAGIRYKLVAYSGASTGVWDDLVNLVADGELDGAATLLIKSKPRECLVDFTEPFMYGSLSVLYHGNRGVIRDSDELLSGGFRLGTLNSSAILDVMADSTDTTMQEVLSVVLGKKGALEQTISDGVLRARHSSFAFIIDTALAEFIVSQPPCEMKTFRLSSDVFPYALAVRKRSPLGARLSAAIMELRHSGELQEIYKHSVYDPRVCFED